MVLYPDSCLLATGLVSPALLGRSQALDSARHLSQQLQCEERQGSEKAKASETQREDAARNGDSVPRCVRKYLNSVVIGLHAPLPASHLQHHRTIVDEGVHFTVFHSRICSGLRQTIG
jgi:hypothetical protein